MGSACPRLTRSSLIVNSNPFSTSHSLKAGLSNPPTCMAPSDIKSSHKRQGEITFTLLLHPSSQNMLLGVGKDVRPVVTKSHRHRPAVTVTRSLARLVITNQWQIHHHRKHYVRVQDYHVLRTQLIVFVTVPTLVEIHVMPQHDLIA